MQVAPAEFGFDRAVDDESLFHDIGHRIVRTHE